jgi:hypothetical protein
MSHDDIMELSLTAYSVLIHQKHSHYSNQGESRETYNAAKSRNVTTGELQHRDTDSYQTEELMVLPSVCHDMETATCELHTELVPNDHSEVQTERGISREDWKVVPGYSAE